MADGVIASAVALPEPEENVDPSDNRLKRRQSPSGDNESKRRRLSADTQTEPARNPPSSPASATTNKPAPAAADGRGSRRKSGVTEERKRGQRLFGALLGTLSQSSSTAAQKRRADIEKKQQAKLKMQDQEYNELTRKKHEDLLAMRREEQRIYDKQSMHLRHSNELAMARFLKTSAQPVLYFKPWQLRPEEEDNIKHQIEECKATIEREVAEFEAKHPSQPISDPTQIQDDAHQTGAAATAPSQEPTDKTRKSSDTVGATTNNNHHVNHENEPSAKPEPEPPKHSPAPAPAPPPTDAPATNETSTSPNKNHDSPSTTSQSKAHEDDAGEVMLEDKEDTVIY
ncbi:hypothetical protein FQN50_009830 [Emmonsiellopsis sp. PD_5]|nr:hypothetical protein FQN50_009830 [Emmonsiellopsis sp. PD_5]